MHLNHVNHHFRLGKLQLAIAVMLIGGTGLAQADALQDLNAKIEALQREVNALKQQQSAAAPAQAVTQGATPGSFKLPGSSTSATIGGYVKLDAIYSNRSAGTDSASDQFFDPTSIPVGPGLGSDQKNQITLHARQSRFYIKTSTPSAYGDLKTHLEFDLFGSSGNESVSNSHNLRVRHAYGSVGGLLAGQTWSNFMDVAALPETLDFGGPAGQIFVRQPQVRWTQPYSLGEWSVALGSPETVATLFSGTNQRADDDRVPDLTGRIGFKTAYGNFSLTALARQVRIQSGAVRDSKQGYGVGFHGVVPTVGKDTFNFGVNAGDGIGRYWGGLVSDGFIDASGRLDLADQYGGFASYRHFWSDQLRSTLVLGTLYASNPNFVVGSASNRFQSAHLNLIWSPVPNTSFGAEYIFGRREVVSGLSGTLNRVQASFQYGF